MPLPVSPLLSLPETVQLVMGRTGEGEARIRATLTEAALTGAITATGCLHLSYLPTGRRYWEHSALDDRTAVPAQTWGTAISWPESRVGRYDLVRFDRADIERWLASAAIDGQSAVSEPQTNEPKTTSSGTRTNRALAAEEACRQWIAGLKERLTKDTAFVRAQDAVKEIGPLSRKAFERAWAGSAPADWKRGGRHKKSPLARI
jgi:hypothetical protein